jgi:hypothetical protein
MTGGNIAVVALGSTGCSILESSSSSAERLEFERSLLAVVFCVSARCRGLANREDILPRCRTEVYLTLLISSFCIPACKKYLQPSDDATCQH